MLPLFLIMNIDKLQILLFSYLQQLHSMIIRKSVINPSVCVVCVGECLFLFLYALTASPKAAMQIAKTTAY